MSFYILQIFVIGFFFTDMTTVAEDASGSSNRVSVPLHTSIPATTSHHFLPAYALCCIDQSVVEEFDVVRDASRLRRQRARIPQQLWDEIHEMSGMGMAMPPAPPRVTLQPNPRGGPYRVRQHCPLNCSLGRRVSVGRSPDALVSPLPQHQPQHSGQGMHFLQRLELSLCAVCSTVIDTMSREEDATVRESSSAPQLSGSNAGNAEE